MGTRTDTRQRMVTSAALLVREHGIAGTTVAKVLEHSQGPRGSVGFHFPGGRSELLGDALALAGGTVTRLLRSATEAQTDPARVFVDVCEHYRDQLVASDFTAGCPVGAAMAEAHHDGELGTVLAGIVEDWRRGLFDLLRASGRSRQEAERLALLAIGSLEGAILLARVVRSTGPIDVIIGQVAPLLAADR